MFTLLLRLVLGSSLVALTVSAAAQEPAPGCSVRGSHEWLSTRASPLDSAVVVIGGKAAEDPVNMFQNMRHVGQGAAASENLTDPVETFTIRGIVEGTGGVLVLEWERVRVRLPITPAS